MSILRIAPAVFPLHIPVIQTLITTYVSAIRADIGFQDVQAELATLPGPYAPPRGLLLLAWQGDTGAPPVACVAYRRLGDEPTCEMKRFYVSPTARGQGVGRQLLQALLLAARAAGYRRMVLDVLPEFEAARRLYAQTGFEPIAPYAHNPVPGTEYLAQQL
jgi:GNAT superfamily N-acetyltransferase